MFDSDVSQFPSCTVSLAQCVFDLWSHRCNTSKIYSSVRHTFHLSGRVRSKTAKEYCQCSRSEKSHFQATPAKRIFAITAVRSRRTWTGHDWSRAKCGARLAQLKTFCGPSISRFVYPGDCRDVRKTKRSVSTLIHVWPIGHAKSNKDVASEDLAKSSTCANVGISYLATHYVMRYWDVSYRKLETESNASHSFDNAVLNFYNCLFEFVSRRKNCAALFCVLIYIYIYIYFRKF